MSALNLYKISSLLSWLAMFEGGYYITSQYLLKQLKLLLYHYQLGFGKTITNETILKFCVKIVVGLHINDEIIS